MSRKEECLYDARDKYWQYNAKQDNYNLHFKSFYDDEIIAIILPDKSEGTFYAYYSLRNVYEGDCELLSASTLKEAKEEVEANIVSFTEESIQELHDWIDKFTAMEALEI